MSKPRHSPPDLYIDISRHTTDSQPLFCPDGVIFVIYTYCLAWCCRKFGIQLLAATLLPDRERLVLYCPAGNLPEFTKRLHRLVALATKRLRRWSGTVWDHRKTEWTYLCTAQAVAEAIAETTALAVAEGYVGKPEDWPGVCSLPGNIGTVWLTAKLPAIYFNPANWPAEVPLHVHWPKLRAANDLVGFRNTINQELKHQLKQARQQAKASGRRIAGKRALRNGPTYRSTRLAHLPIKAPDFRTGRDHRRLLPRLRQALRRFHQAYRDALARWRAGQRSTVFPNGTYAMKRIHSANVACAA